MDLKKILLTTATPFLLSCGNLPTEPKSLLQLTDYTCVDDTCKTYDKELPQNGIRPLRFLSIARYPGTQDYYWEIRWNEKFIQNTDTVSTDQKIWVNSGQQKDYSAIDWDLKKSPKVEYTVMVRVKNDSVVVRWRPVE